MLHPLPPAYISRERKLVLRKKRMFLHEAVLDSISIKRNELPNQRDLLGESPLCRSKEVKRRMCVCLCVLLHNKTQMVAWLNLG